MQDDGSCKACHTADGIKISHRTQNITKNNPEITAGLASFRYEIKSATVNAANDIIIEFGIWKKISPSADESLVTFVPPAPSVSNPLDGFTSSPSFLLPYALLQDDIKTPVEYNNLGRASAQPRTVSVASLLEHEQCRQRLDRPIGGRLLHRHDSGKRPVGVPGGCQAARGVAAGLLQPGHATGFAGGTQRPPCRLGDQGGQRRR